MRPFNRPPSIPALSDKSIRRMIARGAIRAFRPVAGRVLVDLRELDSAIQAATKVRSTRGVGR